MKKQIQAAALALCALMIFATVTSCDKQEESTIKQPVLEEHHPCFELFYRNTGGFLFGKPCIAGLSAFYK